MFFIDSLAFRYIFVENVALVIEKHLTHQFPSAFVHAFPSLVMFFIPFISIPAILPECRKAPCLIICHDFLQEAVIASAMSIKSLHTLISFCSVGNIYGNMWKKTRCIFKSSWKMLRTLPWEIPSPEAMASMVTRLSERTIFGTRSTFWSAVEVKGTQSEGHIRCLCDLQENTYVIRKQPFFFSWHPFHMLPSATRSSQTVISRAKRRIWCLHVALQTTFQNPTNQKFVLSEMVSS